MLSYQIIPKLFKLISIRKYMKHILKCSECEQYTMKEVCGCGGSVIMAKPPKYSPEDKYGHYRRKVKKQELIEKGLL